MERSTTPDFEKGLLLYRAGRYAESARLFRAVTREHPDWLQAHHNLGQSLRAIGDLRGALAAYQRVLAIKPTFVASLNSSASVLSELGRMQEAIDTYERLLAAVVGGKEIAHYNYGVLLADLGRFHEAEVQYRLSIAANAGYASAHYNLGVLFSNERRWEEAIERLRAAREIDPRHENALYMLARALSSTGRSEEALDLWLRYVAKHPGDAKALSYLAASHLSVYLVSGDITHVRPAQAFALRSVLHGPLNIAGWLLMLEAMRARSSNATRLGTER